MFGRTRLIVLLNLMSYRERRLLLLNSYVDRGPFFGVRASVELEKGIRKECRTAFPTQIDVYQSQRTTSNLGYDSSSC